MCGPSVVSVLVLVSSIGIASTATTSNPSAVKSSRSASVSARSIPKNSAGKVITFRQNFGSDEEVCTCIAFHQCDNETSTMITSPTADGQERCSGDEVCCRPKNPPPIPTSTESGGISRVPTDEQNFESDEVCTCVAIRECDSVTSTIIYGPTADGQERCSGDEVCCRPKNPPPIPTSTESSGVSRLPTDEQNFESDEVCTCVAIRECDSVTSTIIYGPTADGQERCIGDEVCCRPKNPSPAPTSTESGGVSPVPKVEQECGIKGKTSNPSEADIDSIISIGVKISNDGENGETVFGEFPWMVALFKTNDYSADGEVICGASLLSPFIVLTAAHCVNGIDKQLLKVRVGEYNIGSDENESLPHEDRFVNDVRIHPNFFPRRLFNDLALLRVDKPFVYDYHINSICAPLVGTPYIEKHSYDPKRCWSIGWGKDNVTHKITQSKLKKVELPIVDSNECQRRLRTTGLGTAFTVDSSFICAGGQKGYDTCKGDGGGPLFCASRANDNKVIQVGIVSWGIGCGTTIPGLYASLEANSEWLTTEFNALSVFT